MGIKHTINECIELFEKGDKKTAFDCVSQMKVRKMSPDQKRVIGVAADMLAGKGQFYLSMGYTQEGMVEKADKAFREVFMNKENNP